MMVGNFKNLVSPFCKFSILYVAGCNYLLMIKTSGYLIYHQYSN
jgi:hypothetical protein